jgi:hypothetical protein
MTALTVIALILLWAAINAGVFAATRRSVQRMAAGEWRPWHWTAPYLHGFTFASTRTARDSPYLAQ